MGCWVGRRERLKELSGGALSGIEEGVIMLKKIRLYLVDHGQGL